MKKTIDDNDVEHIASLAALELSDEEKQAHKKHLQKMLDTFEALDRFDVSDVPPTAHILSAVNVLSAALRRYRRAVVSRRCVARKRAAERGRGVCCASGC